ncbi:MAG: ROK family protein [Rhizobiaceae bacterium]|nr:ROK family protein [Rhizobiaceae bacterium]
MRIGIDWGGTKLELIALDDQGNALLRERVATPQDYDQSLKAACDLVHSAEAKTGKSASVGIGIPGSISPATEFVRNANSVWLNGRPLKLDLERMLEREVCVENDANCFAVSEAVDGAGEEYGVVAGIIIGTGCGSGIAINGKALSGANGVAGEMGHVPLPWMKEDEYPGEECWCGRHGCLETWISGTAFQRDYARRAGEDFLRSGNEILGLGTLEAANALDAYCDRLARGLALLVNMVDPDIIVLGGGMSNVETLYERVPELMKQWVFSDIFETPIVQARHGDSSGVRGAAWLWEKS